MAQTGDIRFSWPDLAKPGKDAVARRSAAIDEALAEGQDQAPPVESSPRLLAEKGGRAEEPRRLAAPPEAVRASLPVAVKAAVAAKVDGRHE